MKKCCGTCKYREYESVSKGWVCANENSEYVADWINYGHVCEEWEGEKNKDE